MFLSIAMTGARRTASVSLTSTARLASAAAPCSPRPRGRACASRGRRRPKGDSRSLEPHAHSACLPRCAMADRESLFAAERSQGPGFRWTRCWASSHTELGARGISRGRGSLIGGLPEVSRPTRWSRRSTRTSCRRSAESSMEARTNEYASDRRERRPPRPPLPRGSGFTGRAAQSPRSADNVPGCRSATSSGRSPTQGFPAARGTGGSC
jgi:hypothetical protein